MDDTFILTSFAPIVLSLERVGPFQERLEQFNFRNAGSEPCNYFLLLSRNGRGKTHILESMAALMGVLGQSPDHSPQPFQFEPLAKGDGRAQLDFLISYSSEGLRRTEVLSIFGGYASDELWLNHWSEDKLLDAGATAWRRIGVIRRGTSDYKWSALDDWTREFTAWIGDMVGENIETFAGSSLTAPTLIYFPAYRDIVALADDEHRAIEPPKDWNYRPLHVFRQEGRQWRESLDNLLVWLMWLDDGRYQAALEMVNDYVFSGTDKELIGIPNRNELVAKIGYLDKSKTHRLDQLSSGEKSLMQIFLRMGAHMTRNTILMIDEVDAHLHPQWRSKIALLLKGLLQAKPGLSVFLASHADEIIESLNVEVEEPGLVKGGELLLTPQEELQSERRIEDAKFVSDSFIRSE
ncbi:AAA family ATPase [Aquitalea sp. ASV15]|uniref:AAA family ATPase n=1 Tax=Aquitalea sp. ASV15 TaxID=2795104 RepID=UPI0018ED05DE|nr:AAA family ATPase [Aquitalea sp. ASV15]